MPSSLFGQVPERPKGTRTTQQTTFGVILLEFDADLSRREVNALLALLAGQLRSNEKHIVRATYQGPELRVDDA